MARIYLVRHGEATEHWTEATDPGLSALGTAQAHAAAQELAPLGPFAIASSPLRRARETAVPLEAAWQSTARIVAAVAELPTPRLRLDERPDWLQRLMHRGWSSADEALLGWRRALLEFLTRCETNIVVFSHYVAINTAMGAALGRDEFAPFKPANASITLFDNAGGRLRLIDAAWQRVDTLSPSSRQASHPG